MLHTQIIVILFNSHKVFLPDVTHSFLTDGHTHRFKASLLQHHANDCSEQTCLYRYPLLFENSPLYHLERLHRNSLLSDSGDTHISLSTCTGSAVDTKQITDHVFCFLRDCQIVTYLHSHQQDSFPHILSNT